VARLVRGGGTPMSADGGLGDRDEEGPKSITLLRRVPLLAELDEETLLELFAESSRREFRAGNLIVSELEPGADMFILIRGQAEVSVDATLGSRQIVGQLGPGSGFGEMSALTGELRSATVTAKTDVSALVITAEEFERLRERRPQIAVALLPLLAERLAQTEKATETLLAAPDDAPDQTGDAQKKALDGAKGTGVKVERGSIRRLFLELVVARKRDLAFMTLVSFIATLLAVRLAVYLSFRFDVAPRAILRTAYMTGFASLVGSACASLLTFRPGLRRWIAIFYGIGLALIFNELGVTLAFDIFYKDIHTADPSVPFDVERLYERGAAVHAIAIGLAVLVQAAYLRRFYARVLFLLSTRARRLLG
jgi:CRP/FNR family cyclic AMP-dependent transcriptional regulator